MLTIIIVLIIIILVFSYVTYNMLRKLEFYENTIEEFYQSLSITLHSMRQIDDMRMFESDDVVGTIFSQLQDILSTLYPLIYGDKENTE